jgi:hypothetical protein
LRTAFLAAVKRTTTGELRADLVLGGRSVLAWQVDLVRALGCERIICLCEAPGGEVLAQQRRVEAAGGEFHVIRSNLQLVSLLRADDELVLLLDGLIADGEMVKSFAISQTAPEGPLRKSIAAIGADHPFAKTYPEDFERIDKDRHWGGFAAMRASQAQKLADMPPDSDAMSLLLRIALQARVECTQLNADALDNGDWILATENAALIRAETAMIEGSAPIPSWAGPGQAIAALIARKIAPRGLEKGCEISAVIAIVLALSGVALSGFGFGAWGIGIAGIGAFSATLSNVWGRLRGALWSQGTSSRLSNALNAAIDLLATVSLMLAIGIWDALPPLLALPPIAIGLARVLGGKGEAPLATFWRDRAVHLTGFAVAAGFGILTELLALFALGAVLQLLLRADRD